MCRVACGLETCETRLRVNPSLAKLPAKFVPASLRDYRRAHTFRIRGGVARSFAPLFLVLRLAGVIFLRDAETHPLTADAAQVLTGSIRVAFSLLLAFFLARESH